MAKVLTGSMPKEIADVVGLLNLDRSGGTRVSSYQLQASGVPFNWNWMPYSTILSALFTVTVTASQAWASRARVAALHECVLNSAHQRPGWCMVSAMACLGGCGMIKKH